MGLLNKKLSSWAATCRRLAGCKRRETPTPPACPSVAAAAAIVVMPLGFPKFPSRQRNRAVRRRRRRPDNNNNGAAAAPGLGPCQLCSPRGGNPRGSRLTTTIAAESRTGACSSTEAISP